MVDPVMSAVTFLQTFVGRCQHPGVLLASDRAGRVHYQCVMCASLRGVTYRCGFSRPLTAAEILIERRNGTL